MKISESGLKMIESFEGLLLKASNSLDGVWTIGYGQTGSYYGKKICKGMTTTKAAAHGWLRDHSILNFEKAVRDAVKVPLNQNQFDALVSFTYNIGITAFKNSTCLRLLNKGDYRGAADAMLMWVHCNGKELAGLVRRRKEERALFLTAAKTQQSNLLRKGDTGEAVKLLQHRLNLCGAQLQEDGIWGNKTEQAVRNFQYYHTLTVDGVVGPKTVAALIPPAIFASANNISNYMVKRKWHYKDGTHKAASTFAATKELKKPGSSCAHFVSWVLQDVGCLSPGKLISHKDGAVTGGESLIDCQIIKAGKLWNKLELQAGDVCVWDSNLAIYAGDGKWWDAGGPFSQNCKNGQYIKLLVNPWYDRNNAICHIVRHK